MDSIRLDDPRAARWDEQKEVSLALEPPPAARVTPPKK